jgi:hypothetical protein
VEFQHNEPRYWLCEQSFYGERNGEVTRPFVKKQPDWLNADVSATNPSADDG